MQNDKHQALVDYASTLTNLKEYRGDYMGCCPVHQERTPSFYIYAGKFQARCYGCGWSGDVFDLYHATQGGSFLDAKKALGFWEESGVYQHTKKPIYPSLIRFEDGKQWEIYELCKESIAFGRELKIRIKNKDYSAEDYVYFCLRKSKFWKRMLLEFLSEIRKPEIKFNFLAYLAPRMADKMNERVRFRVFKLMVAYNAS
jgi:hypothetical protein